MNGDDPTGEGPLPNPARQTATPGPDDPGDGLTRPGGEGGKATPPVSEGLLSHFVRRTDGAFHGVEDKSLIGDDVGWAEDELDEDGEPIVR